MTKKQLTLFFSALFLSTPVLYAAEPVQLDDIVVTSTRDTRDTAEAPAAISTVNSDELKERRLLNPREALSGIPGVQAETRNDGYDARLIIRGAGTKARYGVREIMVLIDGVPLTDPDGMTRFDIIDPQNIEQIEVLRGPNSTLFGANAVGGVINISSKHPSASTPGLQIGSGSNRTRMVHLSYNNLLTDIDWAFNATRKSTNGWRQRNRFETTQIGLNTSILTDGGATIDYSLHVTSARLQLPGTLTKTQFKDDPSQLTTKPFRHSGRYSKSVLTNLRYLRQLDALTIKPSIYLQRWQHDHPVTGSIIDASATVGGLDLQVNYDHKITNGDGTLIWGLSTQLDQNTGKKYQYRDVTTQAISFPPPEYQKILATQSDQPGTQLEKSTDEVTRWGVYLQEALDFEKWRLDLGIRYDEIRFKLDKTAWGEFVYGANRYDTFVAPVEQKTIRTFHGVSPRVGTVYRLAINQNLYANLATAIQTPQASEVEDNPQLYLAHTANAEIGWKGQFKHGNVEVAIFHQRLKDEIVQTVNSGGSVTYANAGRSRRQGLELALDWQPLNNWRCGGSYAYSDFIFSDFDEPVYSWNPATNSTVLTVVSRDGNQLPYVPQHHYSLYLAYHHPQGLFVRAETSTWGSYEVDNANSERYRGYRGLTNLVGGWQDKQWELSVDVRNLFDQKYAVEVDKSGGALRFRPGAPQNVFAKLSLNF